MYCDFIELIQSFMNKTFLEWIYKLLNPLYNIIDQQLGNTRESLIVFIKKKQDKMVPVTGKHFLLKKYGLLMGTFYGMHCNAWFILDFFQNRLSHKTKLKLHFVLLPKEDLIFLIG